MANNVSKKKRSEMMAGIRGKDTKPELKIRSALHKIGYRYKLNDKKLPGKPDLVLPKYNAVIFIHGCFWHLHNCHLFKWPSTRPEFWKEKITGNKQRDEKNQQLLKDKDWRILIIWECALKGKYKQDIVVLTDKIERWLYSDIKQKKIMGVD